MKSLRASILFLFISLFLVNTVYSAETLSWIDCVKEAAKNNPDLIAASEEIKQFQADKTITASALFPQVSGSMGASTTKVPLTTGKMITGTSTRDSYTYGLDATQLIFDGFKTINEIRSASENIKAAQYNYRFTSTEVRLRLRSAFVELLAAQEQVRIAEQIFELRKRNLELVRLRYESGMEHRGALLVARANLGQAKYEIKQARRNINIARQKLTKEMGRAAFKLVRAQGTLEVGDSAKVKPDFEKIAKDNPSLQQSIALTRAANYNLKATYANFFPTITGDAGTGKTSQLWPAHGDTWNAGLTVSLPIFEGGSRMAQVAQARALLNQLEANTRSTKYSVVVALEQTWNILQDMVDQVGVQHQMLLASDERSKIAQAQYSLGYMTFDNWTIIEDNLVKSKKLFLDAQAAALLAQANWVQAKGDTLEYEE
ncbi:MAG: TolC family protein [Candidatus Omnitrophota bacterium]